MKATRNCPRLWIWVLVQTAFLLGIGAAGAAPLGTIIYQDGFTVDGVQRQYGGVLNGTAVETVPEGMDRNWIAPGGLVFAEINGEDVVYANAGSTSAFLDFDLTSAGSTIKVEADVMSVGNTNLSNWVAIGFQPGQASTGHGGAGLWMLFRGNGGYQIFLNGTSTLFLSVDSTPGYTQGDITNISITYNQNTHVATFAINEEVVHTENLSTTTFPAAAKRPFIITYDAGQYFDNYTVSMEGPFPVRTLLEGPRDGKLNVPVDGELSWSLLFPVEGDVTFDVYVDPNALKVESLDTSALVSVQQAASTYVPDPVLEYETTYFWRVVTNVNGEPNQSSGLRRFTTDYEDPHWTDASWTSDADSGISAGKTYTHAINLRGAAFGTVVVNGVPFDAPAGRSGATWVLEGAPNETGGGAIFIEGDSATLVSGFYYNVPASLTLTDLTPGEKYVLTLYTKGWGGPGGRIVHLTTSDDGRTVEYDENVDGDGHGHTFGHLYTAPESGEVTVEFVPVGAGTWHHYAFSNEVDLPVYLDPTPVPGAKVQAELDLGWQRHGEVVNPTYNLYVGTDANFVNTTLVETGLDATTYSVSLDPEVTYYWQVEIVEDGGPVVYESPVWDFVTTPPPDAEKVLEWTMDETMGPIAYQTGTSEDADGILSGFNDPNSGAMFVPGLVGNALLLNGTTEYVDVSDAAPYMPTGNEQAFAVSAYFRTYKSFGPIFSMRNSETGTPLIDIMIGHDGAYESPGRVKMLVRDDSGNLGPNTNSGVLVNDGRWHSLVVMRARGNWTMYVDGIERAKAFGVASGSVSLDWLAIGAEKRWVFDDYGSWNGSRTDIRYFQGMLDEVCVWAGEMQPHQIAELAAVVPSVSDMDYDLDTDAADLKTFAENWLMDSYTPVQPSPLVLEDMESYTSDPNSFKGYWEALSSGVSLENVYGNVATAPTSATVGVSINSIVDDADGLYGQVLRWDYDLPADRTNAIQRFWLRDRRLDLAAYDHISIRVKKLAGSTGDQFYFDFHDGRGMTDPEQGIYPWVLAWQGRIILPLANLPEDQWVTLEADIPGGFNSGRPKQLRDLYEVTIGINSAGVARAGTILIDEIVLSDSTADCFLTVGALPPDMDNNCLVNLNDFAILAENWLQGL